MAKRHIIEYYLEQQEQYLEMLEVSKEFERLYRNGDIDIERYQDATREIDVIKANYERLAYIIYLLNKPNRKNKGSKYDKSNKELKSYLNQSSNDVVRNENEDALKVLKDLIKEKKHGDR